MVINFEAMKDHLKEEMKEEENDLNDEQIAVEESKIMIDFEAVKNSVKKEIKEEDNSIDEVETI